MTFNSWTFAFEVVNFLVLAYILQRLLYRPLHDMIDRRRQGIEQAQAEAAEARQEAEKQRLELTAKLAAITEERRKTLEEARHEAEAEREHILTTAARETAHQGALARERLERERAEALQSLQQDLVHEATRLAERLLRDVSDAELDSRLARRLVDTIRLLPAEQREGLAQGWTKGETATLETAHDLVPEVVEQVHDAVATLLGHDIALLVQPTPELVSGVRLRLDGHVWDASLAGGLEEIDDGHTPVRTS
jgi:F-type H+-transporting ATPase subunit b